jgi:hypothetical protein
MFSPLQVFLSQLAPASSANRQLLAVEFDVNFNVAIPALLVPRVPAVFHESFLGFEKPYVSLLKSALTRQWPKVERDELK